MKKMALLMIVLLLALWSCDDTVEKRETYDSFNIQPVMSVQVAADCNPEIVRMVPDEDDKAVFVASATKQLYPITYTSTGFTIDDPYTLSISASNEEATSIDCSRKIDGYNYVAVCIATTDCKPGSVLLVNFQTGAIACRVDSIGYNPDGCAFTKDDQYLIIACEDDREDRSCKPADRWGGSVTIIDLTNGVANATLLQDYKVDWAEDSEPEHCETNENGDVVVSVQETSQIIIFNVNDAPLTESEITVIDLPVDAGDNECEPDGLFISPDGTTALISNERNGSFLLIDIANKTLLCQPYIVENDLPEGWTYDGRKATKRTEPEEAAIVERDGKVYGLLALQEASAVIVYDITNPANPVFDSIAEAGIDFDNETDETDEANAGSEGLSAHPTNGVVFSANEREGTITMYTAAWAR